MRVVRLASFLLRNFFTIYKVVGKLKNNKNIQEIFKKSEHFDIYKVAIFEMLVINMLADAKTSNTLKSPEELAYLLSRLTSEALDTMKYDKLELKEIQVKLIGISNIINSTLHKKEQMLHLLLCTDPECIRAHGIKNSETVH